MKRYFIAGLTVDMEASGRTEVRAAPYEIPPVGPADITLNCDAEAILKLNPFLEDLEMAAYMGFGAIFSRKLLNFDGSFLHSSAVIYDGRAYLFSAPSGTGKSTHTEKWCRLFQATYLNDDKPALRLVDGQWMAYGTPWSGKHDLSSPVGVPLGGIAFLKRGDENKICALPPSKAVPNFMSQSLWKLQKDQMEKQLALLDSLVRSVPIWELTCRNDDDAAFVSFKAMTGEGIDCDAK